MWFGKKEAGDSSRSDFGRSDVIFVFDGEGEHLESGLLRSGWLTDRTDGMLTRLQGLLCCLTLTA